MVIKAWAIEFFTDLDQFSLLHDFDIDVKAGAVLEELIFKEHYLFTRSCTVIKNLTIEFFIDLDRHPLLHCC